MGKPWENDLWNDWNLGMNRICKNEKKPVQFELQIPKRWDFELLGQRWVLSKQEISVFCSIRLYVACIKKLNLYLLWLLSPKRYVLYICSFYDNTASLGVFNTIY